MQPKVYNFDGSKWTWEQLTKFHGGVRIEEAPYPAFKIERLESLRNQPGERGFTVVHVVRDGEPMPGLTVVVKGKAGKREASTDADGQAAFRIEKADRYSVLGPESVGPLTVKVEGYPCDQLIGAGSVLVMRGRNRQLGARFVLREKEPVPEEPDIPEKMLAMLSELQGRVSLLENRVQQAELAIDDLDVALRALKEGQE